MWRLSWNSGGWRSDSWGLAETPSAPDCSHFIEGETGWRGEDLSLTPGHWERFWGGTTPWLHIWAMGGGTWAVGRALGGHWR